MFMLQFYTKKVPLSYDDAYNIKINRTKLGYHNNILYSVVYKGQQGLLIRYHII